MVTPGTDSYADEDYLTAYADARGWALMGDPSDLLINAMDALEALEPRYQGERTEVEQTLAWPRIDVYVRSQLIDSTSVPDDVLKAQCQYALKIDAGASVFAPMTATGSRSVGDVSVTTTTSGAAPYLAAAQALLRKFYRPAFGQAWVTRA
jgi:hypothetical protein